MWDWIEFIGYLGTTLTIAAWSMRNCLHLRIAGAGSSIAFLAYGALSASYPIMLTELILLPLNLWRLAQLRRGDARDRVIIGDVARERAWFLRHARSRRIGADCRLAERGAATTGLHLVISGRVVAESGRRLPSGSFIGLDAVFAGGDASGTVRAAGGAEIASLSLADARRLFRACPDFAWHLSIAALGDPPSATSRPADPADTPAIPLAA